MYKNYKGVKLGHYNRYFQVQKLKYISYNSVYILRWKGKHMIIWYSKKAYGRIFNKKGDFRMGTIAPRPLPDHHTHKWAKGKEPVDHQVLVYQELEPELHVELLREPGRVCPEHSSLTRQFIDTKFGDSSPTKLKTVHRHFWRQFADTIIFGLMICDWGIWPAIMNNYL